MKRKVLRLSKIYDIFQMSAKKIHILNHEPGIGQVYKEVSWCYFEAKFFKEEHDTLRDKLRLDQELEETKQCSREYANKAA